jgi:MoaA/NifB/PqqE/SkfB family radical SAM enzyme
MALHTLPTALVPKVSPAARERQRAELAKIRKREIAERKVVLSTMPAHVTLEMTTRCNLNCVHCRRFHVQEEGSNTRGVLGQDVVHDIVGSSGYMDDEVFDRSMDLVRDTDWISLCGYGEPLMHPRFFDFVVRLKSEGHTLDTITNGTLLSQANVQKMVDARFDQLSVSIDGVEDQTLRLIRGVGADVLFGGLERFQAIKRAHGLGPHDAPRMSVNFSMGRFNIREMPGLARRLSTLGVHVLYAHVLETAAWPEALGPQLIYTDPKTRAEVGRLVEETKRICAEHDIRTDIRPIPEHGTGFELPGVDLDHAFETMRKAAEERDPPPRVYLPLAAIDQQRREAKSKFKNSKPAGGCGLAGAKVAGKDRLTEAERRENERCLDFFRYAFVTWSGKVISCCFERFGCGDLNLESAEEVWNGPVYQRLRRGYFEDGLRWVCHGCAKILE